MDRVELRLTQVPELNVAQMRERNGIARWIVPGLGAGVDSRRSFWVDSVRTTRREGRFARDRTRLFGNDLIPVAKLHFKRKPGIGCGQAGQEAIHIERRRSAQHICGACKYVIDVCRRDDTQRHLPIDAAEGKVVDFIAKRRNVRAFGRVHLHRQHIVRIPAEMRCEFKGEGSESPPVFAQTDAIDPHGRGGHHALEIDKDALSRSAARELETAAIGGDKAVIVLVEAVPRQRNIGVGNDNFLEC